jgi:hypothetical protein
MIPENDGICSYASVVKKGQPNLPAGKPHIRAVVDGKLYFFSNRVARFLWRLHVAPSGKLVRWVALLAVLAAVIWAVRTVLI